MIRAEASVVDVAEPDSTTTQVWVVVGIVLASLVALDPIGWDPVGPIRWFVVPTLGFTLIGSVTAHQSLAPGQSTDHRLRRATTAAWLALLAWGLVAAGFGADPLHAWIGTPDRRFGWLTWLLCGGLFLAGTRLDRRARLAMMRAVAAGALGLGIITAMEWIGWAGPLGLDGSFADGRLGGPLGQPAYLGAAAALAAPTALGVALGTDPSTRWRVIGGAGAAAATGALVLSQSRAAWLGLAAATVLILVGPATVPILVGPATGLRSATDDRTEAAGRSAATAALPLALVVVAVAAVPSLRGRVAESWGEAGVVDGRLAEWRVGLRALGQSPVIGHGPEGYRTVFGSHVDEAYVIDWGRDVITDRVHSGPLDVAVTLGIPGALLYLLVLTLVAVAALTVAGGGRVRAPGRGPGEPMGPGAAAGITAYGIGQLFLFPLSELDPLFWLLAGGLVAAACPASVAWGGRPTIRSVLVGLAAGLAAVSGLAGLADLAANVDVASAVEDDGEDGGGALDRPGSPSAPGTDAEIELALALRPDSIRYRFVASRLDSLRGDLDGGLAHLDRGLRLSPSDPALRGERGALLLAWARRADGADRAPALAVALAYLRDLLDDDPLHPGHLQRLGIALALSGELEEARTVLERAVELAPDDPEAAANLATLTDLAKG